MIIRAKDSWTYIVDRWDEFEPALMLHVAMGGTMRTAAKNFGVPFPWLFKHVSGDPAINRKYQEALMQRHEYMNQFLFDQFKLLAESDLTAIMNADGSIKDPTDWPENVRQFVSAIEVDELFEGTGRERKQVGWTKKVKLWDKMKALEQLAKHLRFVVDTKVDDGKPTWEQFILECIKREGDRSNAARQVGVEESNREEHKAGAGSGPQPQASGGDRDGDQ